MKNKVAKIHQRLFFEDCVVIVSLVAILIIAYCIKQFLPLIQSFLSKIDFIETGITALVLVTVTATLIIVHKVRFNILAKKNLFPTTDPDLMEKIYCKKEQYVFDKSDKWILMALNIAAMTQAQGHIYQNSFYEMFSWVNRNPDDSPKIFIANINAYKTTIIYISIYYHALIQDHFKQIYSYMGSSDSTGLNQYINEIVPYYVNTLKIVDFVKYATNEQLHTALITQNFKEINYLSKWNEDHNSTFSLSGKYDIDILKQLCKRRGINVESATTN